MPLLTKNVELGAPLKLSSWRKIALGTWHDAGDPSVYGILHMDVAPALAYIENLRAKTGLRVTLSHFMGKAIALTMAKHPEINCMLRFGRIYPRKNVDVFFQVSNDSEGKDLSGMTIRSADKKSIPEIVLEMQSRVRTIREEGDPAFKKMKNTMGWVPGFLSRYLLNFISVFLYTLNLWTPLLGAPRDSFGSVMVTNIGSLGVDMAFGPLVAYSRVPILIALGNARETPVVKDGQLAVGMISQICVTIDHRLIDGVYASKMSRTLSGIFADPERELGAV